MKHQTKYIVLISIIQSHLSEFKDVGVVTLTEAFAVEL
jgi:hypothetical protein